MADIGLDATDAFIAKWQGVSASELSTSQLPVRPLPTARGQHRHPTLEQDYMFERPCTFHGGRKQRQVCRPRGVFAPESKKLKAPYKTSASVTVEGA